MPAQCVRGWAGIGRWLQGHRCQHQFTRPVIVKVTRQTKQRNCPWGASPKVRFNSGPASKSLAQKLNHRSATGTEIITDVSLSRPLARVQVGLAPFDQGGNAGETQDCPDIGPMRCDEPTRP